MQKRMVDVREGRIGQAVGVARAPNRSAGALSEESEAHVGLG